MDLYSGKDGSTYVVHHGGELRPIQDVLFQNVQQLHQLVRGNLQQDCTERDLGRKRQQETQHKCSVKCKESVPCWRCPWP